MTAINSPSSTSGSAGSHGDDAPGGPPTDWPIVGSFRYLMAQDRWEWSDVVARMHGYEPGTVTPTTELILSHKHPDDRQHVAMLIEQVRRYGRSFSSRHRIVDTGGQVHVVVVVAEQLVDGGKVFGTNGFYVDITDEYESDVRRTLDDVVDEITRNRAIINQAIGMLRLVYGISGDRAFEVLRWLSSQSNIKLREIAKGLVNSASDNQSIVSHSGRTQFDHLLLKSSHQRIDG